MKDFLKFVGLIIGGSTLVIGAMVWYAGVGDRGSSSTAAVQSNSVAESQGVFGPYRFTYTKQDGIVAATFTPFLAHDDATVIGAIRAVVQVVYGSNIRNVSPFLAGQDIAFASPTATYYVRLIKEANGEVHSFTIRTSP